MVQKSLLIICLTLTSLVAGAQTSKPEWRKNYDQGEQYYEQRLFRKALSCYQRVEDDPAVSDSTNVQLFMLKRKADCYYALMDNEKLVETLYTLKTRAMKCGAKPFVSMALFLSGATHHYHGQKDKGYSYCLEALEMMKESDYPQKHVEMRDFYAKLIIMYARDGRYEEAERMSRHQEGEALYPTPGISEESRQCGLRQVYALRASMYAHAGQPKEADRAYAAWKKTAGCNPIDDINIYEYLELNHHYEEAHDILYQYRTFIAEQGDSISFRVLFALNRDALLHVKMGDYEKAADCGAQVASIAHQLHLLKSGEQMQTTYELIQKENESMTKSKWLMWLGFIIVLAALVTLGLIYYNRREHRHFRDMRRLVKVLEAYRQAIINGESTTSPAVVAAIEELRAIKLPSDVTKEGNADEEPDDEDRRLFVEMDMKVSRDRLFLKPTLGRDDLMRLIGVDKNRFGKMMGKYSDASNASVYINIKRVTYGAQLLLEHPEYTIATVAVECGMSNTVTFNRTFKEIYNMTPSEYREKFFQK